MHPHKGKPPTRGAQQIMKDNVEIYSTYRSMALGLTIIRLIISAIYTVGEITPNLATESVENIILCHFSIPILLLVISYVLKSISLPYYANTPERILISPGFDLARGGSWGKCLQEITVIVVLAHVLSVISNMFWLLLLYLPGKCCFQFYLFVFDITDSEKEELEKSKKKAKKTGKKKTKYARTITHWHHFRS